jgi:5-methylcytosine-specific restriction enzyme subunit McrC
MNDVFEDFVVVALREALALSEKSFPKGAKNKCLKLDEAQKVSLRPDLSWWESAKCTFVGDVKYKKVSVSGVEHPDIYQLLSYTIATDLPGGLLVYAAGEGKPVTHQVVKVGKHLEVATLNLTGSPDDIIREVGMLAGRVRSLHDYCQSANGLLPVGSVQQQRHLN